MATVLLASGLSEAQSDPVTLADGAKATLFLTGPGAGAAIGSIAIQLQAADNTWADAYAMEAPGRRTAQLNGPMTFRVARRAGGTGSKAVGVDRA